MYTINTAYTVVEYTDAIIYQYRMIPVSRLFYKLLTAIDRELLTARKNCDWQAMHKLEHGLATLLPNLVED